MSPDGEKLNQKKANKLSLYKNIIIICGHYNGIDERIRKNIVNSEISIGDYVLTGGELPAAILIDSIARLIPGVLSNESTGGNARKYKSYKQTNFNLYLEYLTKGILYLPDDLPLIMLISLVT